MDWDQGAVSTLSVQGDRAESRDSNSRYGIQNRFREFLRHFREGNIYYYRDQLMANYRKRLFCILVDLAHVNAYDPQLQNYLMENPSEYLPLLECAAQEALKQLTVRPDVPSFQIVLKSDQTPLPLRHIHAQDISHLIKIPGIIISANKVRSKAKTVLIKCRHCGNTKTLHANSAYSGVTIPTHCDSLLDSTLQSEEPCPKDSYLILPDKCTYIDQQTLKLQENPEVVPTGEMPRHVLLSTDRYLIDKASPGTRVSIIGISSVFKSAKTEGTIAIRTPYIRVVGIEVDEEGAGRSKTTFLPSEEEKFHEFARDVNIYDKISKSIAPSIYGDYTVNIKKAIACQLISGSRKQLPDGMMLRGDINILLLGDPSTAKSQFLKFTQQIAPVGIYTSGKGSSAAGLTASVLKDAKGEFRLEGGAMVLADGGIVCIDEFDKMRESDRVAIHEAMEQQTISIAKAGITTVLNSRASVLAAANPVFGRYDDMRSASENIDMMSTILSRFDLIFIVRDIQDDERDKKLAAHIVRVHSSGFETADQLETTGGEISIKDLKRYVTYCRTRCAPRLTMEASKALQDFYVSIRDNIRKETSKEEATIPVTVRQLEALIRVSESLAKMTLSCQVTSEHVEEAIRLFRVSTLNAANEAGTKDLFDGFHKDAEQVETQILQTLRLHHKVQTDALYYKLESQGFNPNAIQRAIRAMVKKGLLRPSHQYKMIERLK